MPLDAETLARVRSSPTCLGWKRAEHLSPDLRVQQGAFKTAVGHELAYSAVFPPREAPLRGVVVFLHGVNEHSERYLHVFEALCGHGFGALAYDLRSHGKSHMDVAGLRGHVDDFASLVADTNAFVAFAKRELLPSLLPAAATTAPLPLLLMGMSLGTLVACHTVLSGEHAFHGLVLMAPAVSVEMTPVLHVLKLVSSVLTALAPRARLVPGVAQQWVCRDPLVNLEFAADPLTTNERITCLTANTTLHAMEQLQREPRVEQADSAFAALPVLLMMGSLDRVTSLPLARQFFARLANRDKTFVEVDGAYHVLFDDPDRALVLARLSQWLCERFPAAR
ncbi:hypothetical protein P43SY_007433 [Pythium insidiosum]|uniref:Serine aminopeptidase S33 domain-containing protein n=1 Tax=Pythium insidiosum TaxID=114742 RepID=A0AAD5Q4Y3_PYTIN|nr:hypothetical protein P43SY_007433 [Pythium insidiosum]